MGESGTGERGPGMEISDFEYTRMAQFMEQQRRHIAALEQENHELRRQVEDLRRGAGMAIVVQGRVIPVNPAPAEMPLPNAGPVPHPSFGPAVQQAQPAPQSQPYFPRPVQYAQPAPRPEVFSEEMWITGQMRAVGASVPPPAPRPISPSQDMTPSWLREDPTPAPTPAPSSAKRHTLATATGSHPALPKPPFQQPQPPQPSQQPRAAAPNPQQTGRQRVPARPLSRPPVHRLEAIPLPSLAQLTGQHPAIHIPGRQQQPEPGERTPYSDSFVLG